MGGWTRHVQELECTGHRKGQLEGAPEKMGIQNLHSQTFSKIQPNVSNFLRHLLLQHSTPLQDTAEIILVAANPDHLGKLHT